MTQLPIYNNDARFGSTLAKTSCPGRRDICGNGVVSGILSTSYVIPRCGDVHKFEFTSNPDESPYGCCVVDTSLNDCDDFHKLENTNEEDYSMGINLIDAVDTNEAIQNPRKICHSAPIRKRTIKLAEFFITILWSTLAIIGAALIGGCYEFWFKYGTKDTQDTDKCYKIKNNIGTSVSQIEFSFPTNINAYPYKTIVTDDFAFFNWPYTWLQFEPVDKNITVTDRSWLSCYAIWKALLINFLLMLIFSRVFISKILTTLSREYKKWTNPIFKDAVFLVITGILFYIISKTTRIQEWNIGIGFIFFLLLIVVVVAMICVLIATIILCVGNSSRYNKLFSAMVELEPRHELFHGVYYPFWKLPSSDKDKIRNFGRNLLLGILSIITGSCAIGTGFIGALLGLCYMVVSLFCNIFFVPIYFRYDCLLTIIKEHSELLIILFCLSIVISSHQNLNSTTTIVIALLVGIIVLYKIFTGFNSKST